MCSFEVLSVGSCGLSEGHRRRLSGELLYRASDRFACPPMVAAAAVVSPPLSSILGGGAFVLAATRCLSLDGQTL